MSMEDTSQPQPPYPIHPSVQDRLHPQYVDFYNKYLLNAQQVHYQPVAASRVGGKIIPGGSDPLPVGKKQDFSIERKETRGPPVKVRCFTPPGEVAEAGWPVMLYSHGGGWVLGNIDTENAACTNMCIRANCVVVTVDYRLAPEDPYPAAVHDVWEALLWTLSEGARELNLDLNRYSLGGSSAGANLAAVMAQKLLSRPELGSKLKIRLQLLVVPVTDNTATVDTNMTWRASQFTPALSAVKMMWYRHHYLPNQENWADVEASPLLFDSAKFALLPPAQILVGEVDILRHEGEEFGRKLHEAGVPVKVEVMKGMPHPFMAMDSVLDEGQRAINIMCESLKLALHV